MSDELLIALALVVAGMVVIAVALAFKQKDPDLGRIEGWTPPSDEDRK